MPRPHHLPSDLTTFLSQFSKQFTTQSSRPSVFFIVPTLYSTSPSSRYTRPDYRSRRGRSTTDLSSRMSTGLGRGRFTVYSWAPSVQKAPLRRPKPSSAPASTSFQPKSILRTRSAPSPSSKTSVQTSATTQSRNVSFAPDNEYFPSSASNTTTSITESTPSSSYLSTSSTISKAYDSSRTGPTRRSERSLSSRSFGSGSLTKFTESNSSIDEFERMRRSVVYTHTDLYNLSHRLRGGKKIKEEDYKREIPFAEPLSTLSKLIWDMAQTENESRLKTNQSYADSIRHRAKESLWPAADALTEWKWVTQEAIYDPIIRH